jgi:hypothetical protein
MPAVGRIRSEKFVGLGALSCLGEELRNLLLLELLFGK